MGITTLVAYLFGGRHALLAIAGSRWALAIGCLFVISAGLAREYDGEDLRHEPWHVVIPLAVSVGSSFALYTLGFLSCGGIHPRFFSGYLSFLGLFWMTAPLAWLYAVPYERFVNPADAMRLNLATLGIVSLWRVALMVRVFVVWFQFQWYSALSVVMAFSDIVALIGTFAIQLPLVGLMGGVRLSPAEQVLQAVTANVICLGGVTLPFWLIGLFTAFAVRDEKRRPIVLTSHRPTWPLWLLTVASLLVWPLVLPFTQPEQQLRRHVEEHLAAGRNAEALDLMPAHTPEEFPPHWTPPLRRTDRFVFDGDELLSIWEVLASRPAAPWVRDIYLENLRNQLAHFRHADMDALSALTQLLVRLPEGEELMAQARATRREELPMDLEKLVRQLRAERDKRGK